MTPSPLWFRFLRRVSRATASRVGGFVFQRNWLSAGAYLTEADARNGHVHFESRVVGPYAHAFTGGAWRRFVAWYEALESSSPDRLKVPGCAELESSPTLHFEREFERRSGRWGVSDLRDLDER